MMIIIVKPITTAMMIVRLLNRVLSGDFGCGMVAAVSGVVGEHSPSLRDEMATGHCESTVRITPVTMILAPPLSTQSCIREMR